MKPKFERFNISNKPPDRIAFKLRSARGNIVYVEDKRRNENDKGREKEHKGQDVGSCT